MIDLSKPLGPENYTAIWSKALVIVILCPVYTLTYTFKNYYAWMSILSPKFTIVGLKRSYLCIGTAIIRRIDEISLLFQK